MGEHGSPVSGAGTVSSTGTPANGQCNGASATAAVTNMDNTMGQMGQMAPLGLSQSMDSVNTASNEEEVGQVSNYL